MNIYNKFICIFWCIKYKRHHKANIYNISKINCLFLKGNLTQDNVWPKIKYLFHPAAQTKKSLVGIFFV